VAASATGPDVLGSWRGILRSSAVLLLPALDANGSPWRAAMDEIPGMTVGGLKGIQIAVLGEDDATRPLLAILKDRDTAAAMQACLEQLLEMHIASSAPYEAETAAVMDSLRAEVIKRRNDAQRQSDQLQASLEQAAAAKYEAARLGDSLKIALADSDRLTQELEAANAQLIASQSQISIALARSAEAEEHLAAILGSTSWRITQPLRSTMHHQPRLAWILRRGLKLAWWTVTFQLPARYRARQSNRIEPASAPNPPQLPTQAAPPDSVGPSTATCDFVTRGEVLPRMQAVEDRTTTLESWVQFERGRLDWALGTIEGTAAALAEYHAFRRTDEYRAAFNEAEPLVSVCIATMDRADLLLERSIASVLAQSYRNLELIVVGDNCRDETERRLACLNDDRIRFVNLPERGPYPRPGPDRWYVAGTNAMNRALSLCQGHFITHLDDDDAMVPHRIETLVRAALDGQADFLWHPFWYESGDGTWKKLGNGRFEFTQVTTGSIFYHRYFARFPWKLHAYQLNEPGDWNRLRKIKLLRPRLRYVDEPLLYHHVEQSQGPFVERDGERFLD
jgi:hypothetical protein